MLHTGYCSYPYHNNLHENRLGIVRAGKNCMRKWQLLTAKKIRFKPSDVV